MARTATVTKKEVSRNAPTRYIITVNLQYKEDDTVLIDQDYSQEYLFGENPGIYVSRFITKMQADIDDYKASESLFNNALLTTAVSNIQAGLVV
jgi:hypothetical protein